MSALVARLDQAFYPAVERNWDDHLFRQRLLGKLRPGDVLLDVGAGAGIIEAMNFRGIAARVHGVDLDPRVLENPFLDEAAIASAEKLPYDEGMFDIVIADNVFEHLPDPVAVLREVARVLRPGGRCFIKTPNVAHYMPTIARLTPHRFHAWYNRVRGRHSADTFPTLYRANTERALRVHAQAADLQVERIEHIEGRPEYLRVNAAFYAAGIAYERLVNSFSALAGLRILLIAEFRKASA
jgi:SAM-dependent methyltransferase